MTLTLRVRQRHVVPAAYYRIRIGQGETWRMSLRLSNPPHGSDAPGDPLDLSGYTARMQIRASVTSPNPLVSLTSDPGGGITITPEQGRIDLYLSDDTTAAFAWRYGVYDLEIESPDGETTRLLRGEVTVDPEVTR